MTIVNIQKHDDFHEVIKSNSLVVVHFYAEWATQCGPMNDVLEELSKQTEFNNVKFVKCLAEDLPDISLKYNVSAVPTFLLLRGDAELDRVNGANAAELTQKINQQVSKVTYEGVLTAPNPSTVDLKIRLKRLVNSAPVMLFMKGTAQEPKCGFSKSIIQILNDSNVEYKTFDILNDEEVRQGLKTFSNWPTYPQLYANGELIGGLDIVKELHENGELKEMLLVKTKNLEERLKMLINKAPCMIFMKGNQQAPRCGFSRQLMDIMKDTQIPFETFDILTDEEVRQGLKTYSNWPTYPQVYVKGELVGGLDIINELKATGELLATLNGQS